jgi:hypothetical protein
MPFDSDDDLCLEAPVTRPPGWMEEPVALDPVLVVVESRPSLALAVRETCAFLRVGVVSVTDPLRMHEALAGAEPLAVLYEADGINCVIYDLVMMVAGIDRGMPLMVMLPPDPRPHAALEAAQRLWQLEAVTPRTGRPGVRALIDFLFVAGRRLGHGRFMPG